MIAGARFVPGTTLGGRYRIVALVGKGGMGEVYRAEDLKLGQLVALKFLPEAVAQDGVALARFHREVRVARQVSHGNVSRVFDIGEADGLPFISMEFVDGEDLGSLLRRIGRLPADKALEIARQLCAGLAAAHENGVLHRDLKPANVMIDGRGKARITDFGLAGMAEDLRGVEARGGTPAYMAPEQLAGGEASVKSDIYSLGLLLYELFTGKRAFEAATIAELRRLHEHTTPSSPSSLVKEMDPLVERVILRCLAKGPAARPASALQVAAALPGGDPLAAALAAGETPSPEMVAAAGETEGLQPPVAWLLLAVAVVALVVVTGLNIRVKLYGLVPLEKPPESLTERAQDILAKLGYQEKPADSAIGFEQDFEFLRYIREHDQSKTRWDNLEIGAVTFWYRQGPRIFEPRNFFGPGAGVSVTLDDPAPDISGMASVQLTPRGRLVELLVVPPQVEETQGSAAAPDWSVLFAAAGLDQTKWKPTEPRWLPRTYADTRAAWLGVLPERPNTEMRIEAAAYRGQPVYFHLIGPWTRPQQMQPFLLRRGQRVAQIIFVVLFLALLVGGALLARRNLRLGRGDRRGATRLVSFMLALGAVAWLFGQKHVPSFYEIPLFLMALAWTLLQVGLIWMLYIAMEPYVRRRMPQALISWSRLLAGGIRDPLVGRDILVGCTVGAALPLLGRLNFLLPTWLGYPLPTPTEFNAQLLTGTRILLSHSLGIISGAITFGLILLFLLFLLRVLLRRQWAAAVTLGAVLAAVFLGGSDLPWVAAPLTIIAAATLMFVLMRFGLVVFISTSLVLSLLNRFPITPHLSAWYAGIGLVGLAIIAVLAVYSFHTSLGGRPMFGAAALED